MKWTSILFWCLFGFFLNHSVSCIWFVSLAKLLNSKHLILKFVDINLDIYMSEFKLILWYEYLSRIPMGFNGKMRIYPLAIQVVILVSTCTRHTNQVNAFLYISNNLSNLDQLNWPIKCSSSIQLFWNPLARFYLTSLQVINQTYCKETYIRGEYWFIFL